MKKIKLLVVDDSILFREVLARYIRQDEKIEIVGTAGDAYSARDLILKYEPDVMTLDIEMPRMDGLAFLKKLLPQYFIPTIIVSSSEKQAQDAVAAGAYEFIPKPPVRTNSEMQAFGQNLCAAIKRAYTKNIGRLSSGSSATAAAAPSPAAPAPQPKTSEPAETIKPINSIAKSSPIKRNDLVIALGASTGGTEALEQVLRVLPADMPPILIVQHMPAGFTTMYAERLNRNCKIQVKEAQDGDRLRRGLAILGAGENQLKLCRDGRGYYVSSKPGPKVSGHCPSVDVLFNSVAEVAKENAIGAIFTGMGRDGADGLLRMRQAGAFTVGQDKQTCVVYGMPMEAFNCGAVQVQAPLYNIAEIIVKHSS